MEGTSNRSKKIITQKYFSRPRKNISNKPFPYNLREWIPDIPTEKIEEKLSNKNRLIRVINYNILCDSLLLATTKIKESEIETKLPHLLWKNRRRKIIDELKELNGDIIALEEVEKDVEMLKELSSLGYEISFKPRTGEHSEGCGILWKKSKFDLINLVALEFNMNRTNINVSPVYDRDNVSLFGIFSVKEVPDTIIIVCVTHLLFNRSRGDVKLGQIYQTMNSFEELKRYYETKNQNAKVYMILCGDFNSTPKSGIYKLLVRSQLVCNTINKYTLSGQDPDNLQYIKSEKVKKYLINKIATQFKGDMIDEKDIKAYEKISQIDIIQWFNEICRVHPVLKETEGTLTIELEYNTNYKYQDANLILSIPRPFRSAYSSLCYNLIHFIANPKGPIGCHLPFNLIEDINDLDGIEVNGIKMGIEKIQSTIKFISGKTLDVPMNSYRDNTLMSSDFIFYYGENMKTARILNIPDINKIVFDIGFMPNEVFPSDHLSIGADLIIGGEK